LHGGYKDDYLVGFGVITQSMAQLTLNSSSENTGQDTTTEKTGHLYDYSL